ncbi:MAG: hypothetical protein LBJ20_06505, partial [Candidatus Methanoplasma sp.]|nr:hypothetical protein [Candidatus Methanoplasma sp.]
MDKPKFETKSLTNVNAETIAALFPSAVTEGKRPDGKTTIGIDFDVLRQMLSEDIIDGDEKYEFTWVGKREAVREAGRPIRKTLRPSAGGGG